MKPGDNFYDSEEGESEGINISPLIDVIFILLLFFVVTSVFIEESGLTIDKPESKHAQPIVDIPTTILITANHEIYLGEQQTELRAVRGLIAASRNRGVVIRADGAVRTDFLVLVMDEAKAAGVQEIALAADKVEP